MNVDFTKVIASVKKAKGWKSKDLARELSVDVSTVSKWINGRWNPNPEAAKKLLDLYSEVAPPEAPENLDPIVKKYCEEDEKIVREAAESYIPKPLTSNRRASRC